MPSISGLPNAEYWMYRAQLRMSAIERGTEPYLDIISDLNARASTQIQADISKLIGLYQRNGQLEYDDAMRLLSTPLTESEIMVLREQAMLIEDLEERYKTLARLNAPSYQARIQRLQGIELAGQIELKRIAPEVIKRATESLMASGQDAYLRTVFDLQKGTGLGYNFTMIRPSQIEEVLKQKWSGEHYSTRIWSSTEEIAGRMPKLVQQNMLTGRSWRRCISEVDDLVVKGGQYSAERILRTETAYVANEMEAEAYEDADIDKYEFVATLDNRTSEVCQAHDGKIYDLEDRKPGTNFPPLHPFCRSTTVELVDDDTYEGLERRAKDPQGETILVPATMKYPEWKALYGGDA